MSSEELHVWPLEMEFYGSMCGGVDMVCKQRNSAIIFFYLCLNSVFANEILRVPVPNFNSAIQPEAFISDSGNLMKLIGASL